MNVWLKRAAWVFAMRCAAGGVAAAATYYVATNGDDAASGLSTSAPLRTIQEAGNRAFAGDTILVRGGEYREQDLFDHSGRFDAPIRLGAYADEIPVLKGSAIVTNWVLHTNFIWRCPGWPSESQQVFDDGRPLQQIGMPSKLAGFEYQPVGTNLDDVAAGSFYYDTNTQDLFVWLADNSDPHDSLMEASTNFWLLWMAWTSEYWQIEDLVFRHSSSCTFTNGQPAVVIRDGSTIDRCDIRWTDFIGLSLYGNCTARDCALNNNGNTGFHGLTNTTITGCTLFSNTYRTFKTGWHAGGMKMIPNASGLVESNEVAWNRGPGIWFDYGRSGEPIVIRNNEVHHNSYIGIMLEITKNALVENNLVWSNNIRGIYAISAEGCTIRNNTIVGNWSQTGDSAVGLENYWDQSFPLRNNRFYNNIVYDNYNAYDLIMTPETPASDVTNNRVDYNCYYRPGRAAKLVQIGGLDQTNVNTWAAVTGWDRHSLQRDPLFADAAKRDFHLRSAAGTWSNAVWVTWPTNSPCIDTGHPDASYALEPEPNGGRANMGRYGNTSQASKSADSDGDGLSDSLEAVLGSDPDLADTDGDGVNDAQEWIAGTSVTSTAAFPWVNLQWEEPGLSVQWYGYTDRWYEIAATSNADKGGWTTVSDLVDDLGVQTTTWRGTNAWIFAHATNNSPDGLLFRLAISPANTW